jgi:hypothetical protein
MALCAGFDRSRAPGAGGERGVALLPDQPGFARRAHAARGGEGNMSSPVRVGRWEDVHVLINEGWKEE